MSDQLMWFKSSYSGGEGGACVEVALSWRKSTYSDSEGDACVEVATCPTTTHIRDSKLTVSPQLAVAAHAWGAFLTYACAENAENGES
ncbi:DUF397 domain-containing protein [Streptomyces corynorhini]|uniref:DUF397 domain-containing protein n=1 Tax=Streptomyces corynorhini TaxID=2282652 RepID=A0A370B4D1_9ACTN|nr:DUF397 domain-containing protein [Streptomyces corynorhini]RDG36451.1 DUF397 domain-containing protein [Streptomyces corynorhini]